MSVPETLIRTITPLAWATPSGKKIRPSRPTFFAWTSTLDDRSRPRTACVCSERTTQGWVSTAAASIPTATRSVSEKNWGTRRRSGGAPGQRPLDRRLQRHGERPTLARGGDLGGRRRDVDGPAPSRRRSIPAERQPVSLPIGDSGARRLDEPVARRGLARGGEEGLSIRPCVSIRACPWRRARS